MRIEIYPLALLVLTGLCPTAPYAAELAPSSAVASPATNVTIKPGFAVEKLFAVPREMGSWVAITLDDRGRLIVSDQAEAGMFVVTPAEIGNPQAETLVQKLPVKLSGAQGLACLNGSLFAMINGASAGLHQVTDTNGDGLFDAETLVQPLQNGGEHGPHAVILSADGKSLLACAGNHTPLPDKIAGSRIPQNWGEDLLLPRRWDANGHATGILAPAGWICSFDATGKNWEVFNIGYRNEYDIAFNADGELFSYDADMEWDYGLPWYRPTRVCHATSGAEFGWRSGSGKWPAYYEDSLPGIVDIGPGSPVGITFGYGTRFPARYQKALFALDWTYSTIYAIHLTPEGSSYRAEVEDFAHGQPLQVTDAVIGKDGALYFIVGGRGTQSALYRIRYTGEEAIAPVDYRDPRCAEQRALRHKLESYHRAGDADLELIWSNLASEDRFLRYAARVALEHRPLDQWQGRALAETNPQSAIMALMALARQGKPADLDSLLGALEKIDFARLDEHKQLAVLRTYELAFVRQGKPGEARRHWFLEHYEPQFPSASEHVNAELVQLLIYLQSPTIVPKAVAWMEKLAQQTEPVPPWSEIAKRNAGYGGTVQAFLDNMPPVRAIHYAVALRNANVGWTPELRRTYFKFFQRAAMHPGGSSFPGYLKNMRDDALANVPKEELPLYDDILSVPLGGKPFQAQPAKGPGRKWSKDEALTVLGPEIRGANFASGHNLFYAASCANCHRLAGEGGAIGPDLSTAGRKFSLSDLMDAILEPSKAISDQYGSSQLQLSDGRTLTGRAVEVGDEVYLYPTDANATPIVVKKDDVEEMRASPISQMPVGVVDGLNPQELKDLVAYVLSAANKDADVFKP